MYSAEAGLVYAFLIYIFSVCAFCHQYVHGLWLARMLCYAMFSTTPSSDGQAFLGAPLRRYFDPISNVNRSLLKKCSLDVNYFVHMFELLSHMCAVFLLRRKNHALKTPTDSVIFFD